MRRRLFWASGILGVILFVGLMTMVISDSNHYSYKNVFGSESLFFSNYDHPLSEKLLFLLFGPVVYLSDGITEYVVDLLFIRWFFYPFEWTYVLIVLVNLLALLAGSFFNFASLGYSLGKFLEWRARK